jgi:hypothetical protein
MSFWRPRDIIKYVAVLYDANEKNIDKHKQIDMVTLKNLLNDVTEDIIEDEFYNEYDKLFYNLSDFMNMFEGKNIIMPSAEFVDIIRNFKFEGVIFTNNKDNMMDKISFIYEMGVVGLKFKEEYIRAKGIGSNLCFVFNEGTSPFKKSYKEIQRSSREIEIVLNPIFSKKLSLVYNTTEVVGNYDWDYLMSNHMRKSGIKRV